LYCLSKQNQIKSTSIKVKVNSEWVSIDYDKISHIESIGNYIKIYIAQNKSFVVYETLKGISDKLQNDDFIQIHKSFIVNIHFTTSVTSSKVQLGLLELPLGRKYELLVANLFKKRI